MITINLEEELTHEVLAGFQNDFAVSGLGHSLDVLVDEGIDMFVANPAIADLDK